MKIDNLYTGLWWLPNNPEKKHFGSISIDKGNVATLLLFAKLGDSPDSEFNKYNYLTGLVFNHDNGKDYTIQFIDAKQKSVSTQVLNKYMYQSGEYLIKEGNHGASPLRFNEMSLFCSVINEWIKPTGIKVARDPSKKLNISFNYSQPEAIKFYEDDQMLIYCHFWGKYEINVKGIATINESKWINVELKNSISLDEFHKKVASLENLFTLVFKGQIKFTSIKIKDSNNDWYEHFIAGRKHNFWINKSSKEGIDFDVFKNDAQSIFENWFQKSKELKLIINNFFTAYGNNTMYPENKFLAYISILEQYHRLRVKDYNPKGESYMRMYDKVLSELKGDSLSWVKKRLGNKSEIILHNRLKDLIERAILQIDGSLIHKIVKTRNYYVHLNDDENDTENGNKDNIIKDIELVRFNISLEKNIIRMFNKEFSIENTLTL